MNKQDVAIVPTCEECGERWLPDDSERWRAVFLDDGPEDRLGFGASRVGRANSAPKLATSEVGTGVGTARAFPASLTCLSA
jgi:hypothetical protein